MPKSNQTANVNRLLIGIKSIQHSNKEHLIMMSIQTTLKLNTRRHDTSNEITLVFFSGVSSCFSSLCVSCVSCLSLCVCGVGVAIRLVSPGSPLIMHTCQTRPPAVYLLINPAARLHRLFTHLGPDHFLKASVVSTAAGLCAPYLVWVALWTVTAFN